jgi:small-conductance mechanosensitive channel
VPRIQFVDFGDSSLNFRLHFYSQESWRIEFTKSDLRFAVYKHFAAQGIQIPFPQRDIWIRSQQQAKFHDDNDAGREEE